MSSVFPIACRKVRPSPVQEILREAFGQLNLIERYLDTNQKPEPMEILSTDFTELSYAEGARKAHLMAVVDIGSRCALGWAVGPSRSRKLASRCWRQVRARMAQLGHPLDGATLHSDQDSVYTSYNWLRQILLEGGLRVSYSERGAKDNPWIESLWGRLKTEAGSRIDQARTMADLKRVVDERFCYYNRERRHSQIGNQPPSSYLANVLDEPKLTPAA